MDLFFNSATNISTSEEMTTVCKDLEEKNATHSNFTTEKMKFTSHESLLY